MKQLLKLGLVSFLLLTIFSSCKKETQEEQCTTPTCRDLLGEWNLMKYSGGLAGFEDYNKDNVTWTFNSNGTVAILVNVTLTNSIMPIQTSQTETYVVTGTRLRVGLDYDYDIAFENGQLILSNKPELDGPRIAFERD
jgi:hypothetical protein